MAAYSLTSHILQTVYSHEAALLYMTLQAVVVVAAAIAAAAPAAAPAADPAAAAAPAVRDVMCAAQLSCITMQ